MSTCSGKSSYKAVIFDYGGVLVGDIPKLLMEYEAKLGLPPMTIHKVGREGGEDSISNKLNCGKITLREAMAQMNTKIMEQMGIQVDLMAFLEEIEQHIFTPNPEMFHAIRVLREKGYKTAILSNAWLEKPGVSYLRVDRSLFDVIIDSTEVVLAKPDPRIYELCLQRLGLGVGDVVFLDDLDENVEGARKVGITAFKVTVSTMDDSIKELGKLLGEDLISGRP